MAEYCLACRRDISNDMAKFCLWIEIPYVGEVGMRSNEFEEGEYLCSTCAAEAKRFLLGRYPYTRQQLDSFISRCDHTYVITNNGTEEQDSPKEQETKDKVRLTKSVNIKGII